jgi:hypothetical protein
MIGRWKRAERRSPASIAISIAVHAAVVLLLGTATYYIPVDAFLRPDPVPVLSTPIRYVRVAPVPRPGQLGAAPTVVTKPTLVITPLPQLPAPTSIPTGITPVPAMPPGAAIGVPGGTGAAVANAVGTNPKLGVEPAVPDPRISLQPIPFGTIPKGLAQKNDSVVQSVYRQYFDSLARLAANPPKNPADWTTTDKNGQKWGWDPVGIRLGKFTIPNAILAALPLDIRPTGNMNAITDGRVRAWTGRDLTQHMNQASGDDYNAAIKRIRERVDLERREAEAKKATTVKKPGGGQ